MSGQRSTARGSRQTQASYSVDLSTLCLLGGAYGPIQQSDATRSCPERNRAHRLSGPDST